MSVDAISPGNQTIWQKAISGNSFSKNEISELLHKLDYQYHEFLQKGDQDGLINLYQALDKILKKSDKNNFKSLSIDEINMAINEGNENSLISYYLQYVYLGCFFKINPEQIKADKIIDLNDRFFYFEKLRLHFDDQKNIAAFLKLFEEEKIAPSMKISEDNNLFKNIGFILKSSLTNSSKNSENSLKFQNKLEIGYQTKKKLNGLEYDIYLKSVLKMEQSKDVKLTVEKALVNIKDGSLNINVGRNDEWIKANSDLIIDNSFDGFGVKYIPDKTNSNHKWSMETSAIFLPNGSSESNSDNPYALLLQGDYNYFNNDFILGYYQFNGKNISDLESTNTQNSDGTKLNNEFSVMKLAYSYHLITTSWGNLDFTTEYWNNSEADKNSSLFILNTTWNYKNLKAGLDLINFGADALPAFQSTGYNGYRLQGVYKINAAQKIKLSYLSATSKADDSQFCETGLEWQLSF